MRRVMLGAGVVAVIALGAGAYLWQAGGSGEPTTELTTPTLAEVPTTSTSPEPPATDTTQPPPSTDTTRPPEATSELTFVLVAEESQARFELDEELRGNPKHVVGTTSEVAGQVRFDPGDLTSAQLSDIVINARTFETDSESRNRAIRGPVILDSASDEFELITFAPIDVEGLPDRVDVGDSLEFTVTGDLTIKGVTRSTTFDVVARWMTEDRLEGTAETVVDRTDFDIGIPSVPGVANVSEEVLIGLDFVATAS